MAETKVADVILFDPDHESMSYGPNNEIQFGRKGGFAPFIWQGPADHPMLEGLRRDEPRIQELRPEGEKAANYVCLFHPDKEFKTRASFDAHLRGKGHEALLEALQAAQAKIDEPEKADPTGEATPAATATATEPPGNGA